MALNPKTFRTLEFLLLVLTNAAGWLLALVDYIPADYAVYATAGSAAVYAIWRGLAKMNADTKDYWHTTEFWVGLAATIPTAIAAFGDVIPANVYGILQATIAAGLGLGAGLRKQPDLAAGNIGVSDLAAEGNLFVTDKDPDMPDGDDSIHAAVMASAPPAVDPDADKRPPTTGL